MWQAKVFPTTIPKQGKFNNFSMVLILMCQTVFFVNWLNFCSASLRDFSKFALACHMPKKYTASYLSVKCIRSWRFSEQIWSNISRGMTLKMVAIRCVEMGDFGCFLWTTLSSRQTKLPALYFVVCSRTRLHEECTTKTAPKPISIKRNNTIFPR